MSILNTGRQQLDENKAQQHPSPKPPMDNSS
jgi:hypothetical protein